MKRLLPTTLARPVYANYAARNYPWMNAGRHCAVDPLKIQWDEDRVVEPAGHQARRSSPGMPEKCGRLMKLVLPVLTLFATSCSVYRSGSKVLNAGAHLECIEWHKGQLWAHSRALMGDPRQRADVRRQGPHGLLRESQPCGGVAHHLHWQPHVRLCRDPQWKAGAALPPEFFQSSERA